MYIYIIFFFIIGLIWCVKKSSSPRKKVALNIVKNKLVLGSVSRQGRWFDCSPEILQRLLFSSCLKPVP